MASIQEAATAFANKVLAQLNQAATEVVGIDVLWFRLIPDQKNRDVIFQTYTLYGVEDCPLTLKAVYKDTSYDDAAITYQIMGLNYAVPLTLEIPVKTWEEATGNDGTIPQKGDVVFIPMSRKLLQVVSMSPVKAVGAQLTSYKMNMETYKPTRSRIVGDNLRETIKETTTNLQERFGNEIDSDIKDIIDDGQISLHTSTENDKRKELAPEMTEDSGIFDIRSIVSENVMVDGHIVARSYYIMSVNSEYVVRYRNVDTISSIDTRCLSFWVNPGDFDRSGFIKNITDPSGTELIKEHGKYYIKFSQSIGKKFHSGDSVIFERGQIMMPCKVVDDKTIELNAEMAKKMSASSDNWYKLPGFVVSKDNRINVLSGKGEGGEIEISIRNGAFVYVKFGASEKFIRMDERIQSDNWSGFIINVGDTLSLDVYSGNGSLDHIFSSREIPWKGLDDMENVTYWIEPSDSRLTNIRLYTVENTDTDKQIKDLISYNAMNDSKCVINDSADVYLNKPYVGIQR